MGFDTAGHVKTLVEVLEEGEAERVFITQNTTTELDQVSLGVLPWGHGDLTTGLYLNTEHFAGCGWGRPMLTKLLGIKLEKPY